MNEGDHLEESRSAGKRRAIMAAATELFLRQGYPGTSMEQIAAQAAVSKQTVYKHFADKEALFHDIVAGVTERAESIARGLSPLLEAPADLEAALRRIARGYAASVIRPEVIQLRRLVISEAERFPELARRYFEQGPTLGLTTLAAGFRRLAEQGALEITDPSVAAAHFAYLVLGEALDRALLCGVESISGPELEALAQAGVSAFLRIYGSPGQSGLGGRDSNPQPID